MSRPPLHVVPELLAPCRAAKGIAATMIVITLAGIMAAGARTDPQAPQGMASPNDVPAARVAGTTASAAVPPGADYFPSGYSLNAREPTPHIEAF